MAYIHTMEELFEALQNSIQKLMTFDDGVIFVQLRPQLSVRIHQENDGIVVDTFCGSLESTCTVPDFDSVFGYVLDMDDDVVRIGNKKIDLRKGIKIFCIVLGIPLALIGAFMIFIFMVAGVSDDFQPIYTYIFMFECFRTILTLGIMGIWYGVKKEKK